MSKTELNYFKNILETAINAIKDNSFERTNFYSFLPNKTWEAATNYRSMDEYIAKNCIKIPELHYLMRKLVRSIEEYNIDELQIWDQDEEHAGGAIARELALCNKEDVIPYARFISSNDLNHEVYQAEDMQDVFNKWKPCKETYAIAVARWFTPGQHRYEFNYQSICKAMKKESEADAFLEMVAKWFYEEWFPPYDIDNRRDDVIELLEMILEPLGLSNEEIEEIINLKIDVEYMEEDDCEHTGRTMQIQDKQTFESIVLQYDIDNTKLFITYNFVENIAFKFESPEKLLNTIEKLKIQCDEELYSYMIEKNIPVVDEMIEEYDIKAKPLKVSLLSFFTPKGQKTPIDKMNDEAFKGQKTIPCKRIHFFKKVFDIHILICDEAGKRLMDTTVYDKQFLWEFKTDTELKASLADIIEQYSSEGYELTSEDELDYAFDYMVVQMKQIAEMMQQRENFE